MRLSDFDYQLPQELIAQTPLADRSASRMLLVNPLNNAFSDRQFVEIVDCIEAGDLLVFNDTMVIPARLFGRKQSGGQIEVMVERVLDETTLLAQIRASKAPRPGTELLLEGAISCVMQGREGDLFRLQQQQRPWLELLEQYGHIPLPPYIERVDASADKERYQTVYASKPGAVAAPTAGLHFDDAILERLRQKGVEFAHVTLHVGAGTFQPVRGEDIESHIMHAELVDVSQPVCDAIEATRERGNKVIAVGTTETDTANIDIGANGYRSDAYCTRLGIQRILLLLRHIGRRLVRFDRFLGFRLLAFDLLLALDPDEVDKVHRALVVEFALASRNQRLHQEQQPPVDSGCDSDNEQVTQDDHANPVRRSRRRRRPPGGPNPSPVSTSRS